MSLIEHAVKEFKSAGWLNPDGTYCDEMQGMMCDHILKLLRVFVDEGHTGFTAPYALDLFNKLARFKIITPLTGEDDEWNEVADGKGGTMYQNKRYSSVFKDDTGVWDINGKVFWEWQRREDGTPYKSYYTGNGCSTPVTFPYTPKEPEYVYRYSDAEPPAPPQTEEGLL